MKPRTFNKENEAKRGLGEITENERVVRQGGRKEREPVDETEIGTREKRIKIVGIEERLASWLLRDRCPGFQVLTVQMSLEHP